MKKYKMVIKFMKKLNRTNLLKQIFKMKIIQMKNIIKMN